MHSVVDERFPDYFASRVERGQLPPDFVLEQVEAFLRCGDITSWYAEMECIQCSEPRRFPLCCNGRGWCVPCLERRQREKTTFLLTRVIGDVPVRQWVLTLPPPLRFQLAYAPDLVTLVLDIYIKQIFRLLRRLAKRQFGLRYVNQAHPCAVTVVHRASSSLDLNVHFHSLVTDGVFIELETNGPVEFRPLSPPSDADVAKVAWETCRRVCAALRWQGKWLNSAEATPGTVAGVLLLRDPRRVRFCGVAAKRESDDEVQHEGAYAFNVYARRGVAAKDRKNLRNLVEYILSPPFTDKQLRRGEPGELLLDLKRARIDGTETRSLTELEFIHKLVQLTPRPRANLIRFHGEWAPNSRLRAQAVPVPPDDNSQSATDHDSEEDYRAWGELQARSHPEDVMRCLKCGGRLRLIALVCPKLRYKRKRGAPPGRSPGSAKTKDLGKAA